MSPEVKSANNNEASENGKPIETQMRPSSQKSPLFTFTESDFISNPSECDSPFDRLLKQRWDGAAHKGVLKYSIERKSQRARMITPSRYLFIASLIEGRAPGQRRQPEEMLSLKMPFDGQKFNFTKIDPSEVLFRLKNEHGDGVEHSVIVNKSPIEYCSALLVPSLEDCLPQVLTEESLRLAIQVLALSDHQSLRLGFNSLGAMASVNHQHWHLYYYDYKLAIEDLPIQDHILQNWPVPAIVFEITSFSSSALDHHVAQAMKIVNFCLDSDQIAHNLFLTRTGSGSIRLFIWLLEPRYGAKNDLNINPAFCEFSGYFICKTQEMYKNIDEQQCVKLLLTVLDRHEEVMHLLQDPAKEGEEKEEEGKDEKKEDKKPDKKDQKKDDSS